MGTLWRYPTHKKLYVLHDGLCHPVTARLAHFVKVRNVHYSIEDIKMYWLIVSVVQDGNHIYIYPPENVRLIKARQLMGRINIDFKRPLPSNSQNCYILTVIEEYSRFFLSLI